MKFLKYSLGYRAPKEAKTDPEAVNFKTARESTKLTEEDGISKSISNMYSHTQHTTKNKQKEPVKAFKTNRRMTIHELASTN